MFYTNANRQFQSQSGVTPQAAGTARDVTAASAAANGFGGKGTKLIGGQGTSQEAEDIPYKEIDDRDNRL